MKIIAHRGLHRNAPENSVEALRHAARAGVDGVEIDVRCSADGQAVLFHDSWCADGGSVASKTRDELSESVGYPVATLAEALEAVEIALWNVEMKVWDPWDQVSAALDAHAARVRFLVSSYRHHELARVDRRASFELGAIEAHHPIEVAEEGFRRLRDAGVDFIVFDMGALSDPLLDAARRTDLACYAYGVNATEDYERCVRWSLDGVITDRPEELLARRDRSSALQGSPER